MAKSKYKVSDDPEKNEIFDDTPDTSAELSDLENESLPGQRDSSLDNPNSLPPELVPDQAAQLGKEHAESEPTQEDFDKGTDLGVPIERMPASTEDETDEDLTPTKAELSATPSAADLLQQYYGLQKQRQQGDLAAGLMAAGNKIGQSMAGKYSGQFKPDDTGVQLVQQMAGRPVTDFEQGQIVQGRGIQLQGQVAANDPNSPQSKLVREYLKSRFPNLAAQITDDMSANDASMLIKMVGKPQATHFQQLPVVNQQTGEKQMAVFNPSMGTFQALDGTTLDQSWVRDYRAQSFVDPYTGERTGFSGGTGKTTGPLTGPGVNRPIPAPPTPGSNQPVNIDRNMLTAHQAKLVDTSRNQFIKEIKDDRNNLYSTDRVIAALQAGKDLGDLPREDQDQLNRAFGQKGHLSNEQISTVLGKSDWANRFENAVSIGMNGKLTDENRQFLLDTLKVIRDQNEQFIKNRSNYYTGTLYQDLKSDPRLQRYNINPQHAQKLLGLEGALQTGGQNKAVVQKAYNKDKNQTWLKYNDGTSEIVDGQR